jgi:hypothetical protein
MDLKGPHFSLEDQRSEIVKRRRLAGFVDTALQARVCMRVKVRVDENAGDVARNPPLNTKCLKVAKNPCFSKMRPQMQEDQELSMEAIDPMKPGLFEKERESSIPVLLD